LILKRDNTTFPRRHFYHGSHGVVEVFRGENLEKTEVFEEEWPVETSLKTNGWRAPK